jgi:hypothetical protein
MKHRNRIAALALAVAAVLAAVPAQAAFQLKVTEIWPGQDGPDLTVDWAEITNLGDMAWTSAGDGVLTVNDNTGNLLDDVLVQNIPSIAPGESVIVLLETTDPTTFYNVWDPVLDQNDNQVGWADGSGLGLGQGGDSVMIWVNNVLQDSQTFPAAGGANSGKSWDVLLSAFSVVGNASGAVATIATAGNSGLEPGIGSPGQIVPEPSSFFLAGIGVVGLALVIRRRKTR